MAFKAKKGIYLDYAAATPVDPAVVKAMEPYHSKVYGNPSAIHDYGMRSKKAVDDARKTIARILGCLAEEVIFTASGTESIHLALTGVASAKKDHGNHIIISSVEHASVFETTRLLETLGFTITKLPVDEYGLVALDDVKKAITEKTILVSIIYANNEIGTIEPIKEIGAFLKETHPHVVFHTDACQAGGYLPLSVHQLNVDLLTINGSKIYGPKGVALLYKNKRITLDPVMRGGGQEQGLRGGTENIAGVVGLARALELAESKRKEEVRRLETLRDTTIKKILDAIPQAELSGHPKKRVANNIHLTINGIDGETLVLYLNDVGIAATTGAACTERSVELSHVLSALGMAREQALSSIRFSLGRPTTEKELDTLVEELARAVSKIQSLRQ